MSLLKCEVEVVKIPLTRKEQMGTGKRYIDSLGKLRSILWRTLDTGKLGTNET